MFFSLKLLRWSTADERGHPMLTRIEDSFAAGGIVYFSGSTE